MSPEGGWARGRPAPQETPEQRLAAARSWAERGGPEEPAGPRGPAVEISERLQSVVAAAERAAEAIRSDAEQQAQRHLVEARRRADQLTAERARLIAGLTDELIEQAASVKHHSRQMIDALERAASTVDDLGTVDDDVGAGARPLGPGTAEAPARGDDPAPGPPPASAAATPPPAEPTGTTDPSAEVLLRATQMAIAGEPRPAIAERLRSEFGIDPEPVLDQVLGC